MKYLSLLLPTYNRIDKIRKLISYLKLENIFEDLRIEVILSNNGSTDGTYEYVSSLKFQNLTVYNQKENLGIIGNIKFLTNIATGKYVWLLGDNDMYYKGAIYKMIDYFERYPNVAHFFLNYSGVNNIGTIVAKSCLQGWNEKGDVKIYENGFEMICDITNRSELGVLMFISANVFKREVVQAANTFFETYGEGENLALPFGYSMYSGMYTGMCIDEVLVGNEIDTPLTWTSSKILVNCRDILAIYNTVVQNCNMDNRYQKQMRDFLIKHLPGKFPEYRYMFYAKRFGKNNYAMKFYLKHYPWKLVIDIIELPFACIKRLLQNSHQRHRAR